MAVVDYVDSALPNTATWDQIRTAAPGETKAYTAYVIFDGNVYSALCPELDIATDADSPNDALFLIRSAVLEATAAARETGIQAGQPVSDGDLAEFLSHHFRGPVPVSVFIFPVLA